jgi:hypothetical protein
MTSVLSAISTTCSTAKVVRCCTRDEHEFALPEAAIAGVRSVYCAAPPPWAKPWFGGLAWINDDLTAIVDPMCLLALSTSYRPVRATVVVMATSGFQPHWGVVVDTAQEQVKDMHISGRRALLPSGWHCPTEWFDVVHDEHGEHVLLLRADCVADAVAHRYRVDDAA